MSDAVEVCFSNSLAVRDCRDITIDYMAKPKALSAKQVAYTNINTNAYKERFGVLRIAGQKHFPGTELEKLALANESAYLPRIVVDHILVRLICLMFTANEHNILTASATNRSSILAAARQATENLRVRILDKPVTAKAKKSNDERAKVYEARLKAMDADRGAYMGGIRHNLEWLQKATNKMQALKSKAEEMGLSVDYDVKSLRVLLDEVTKDIK